MLGVPTILAIDNIEDSTCGYLYDAPGECVGETFKNMHLTKFDDFVIDHLNKKGDGLIEVGLKCREAAIRKSSTIDEIASFFKPVHSYKPSWSMRTTAQLYTRYYDARQALSRMKKSWQR